MTDDEMRRLERQNLTAVLERANWKNSETDCAAEFFCIPPNAQLTNALNGNQKAKVIQLPTNYVLSEST